MTDSGRPVLVRAAARKDLDGIWDYTVSRWGAEQAEVYLRAIQGVLATLGEHPSSGRKRDELRAGYHSLAAGSHVIFYRLLNDRIDVVRVLHKRMDFTARL